MERLHGRAAEVGAHEANHEVDTLAVQIFRRVRVLDGVELLAQEDDRAVRLVRKPHRLAAYRLPEKQLKKSWQQMAF